MRLVGHPELIDEPWFANHVGRVEHQLELDRVIGTWIKAHTTEEVLAAFEEQEAVIGPIYSIADIFRDPQYLARQTITTVHDETLGDVRIQNAIPRLTDTPGRVRHLGRDLGHDNLEILCGELGHTVDELKAWIASGAVGQAPVHPTTSEEAEP